jgi:hypothetical protein
LDLLFKWVFVVALAFLGGLDTTALALGNRKSLGSLRFSSFWALLNAVAHVAAKAAAPLFALSMGPKGYQCLVALVALWVLYEAAHSLLHRKEKSRWKLLFPGLLLGGLDAVPMSFFKFMVTDNTIESLLLSGLILFLMPLVALRTPALQKGESLARWGHFGVFSIVAPLLAFGLFLPEAPALVSAIATAIALMSLVRFRLRRSHHRHG